MPSRLRLASQRPGQDVRLHVRGADLRADHDLLTWQSAQRPPERRLAPSVVVDLGGVEVGDAHLERAAHNGIDVRLFDRAPR